MKKAHMENGKPNPDPTLLTTEQLLREIAGLRSQVDGQINSLAKNTDVRLDAMDKARTVSSAMMDQVLVNAEKAVSTLDRLTGVKFEGVEKQFGARDKQVDVALLAAEKAVAAALRAAQEAGAAAMLAAKEAVAIAGSATKEAAVIAGTATMKQMDQLTLLVNTMNGALNEKIVSVDKTLSEKIGAVNERLAGGDGKETGHSDSRAFLFSMIAAASAVLAMIGSIVSLVLVFKK